MKWLEKVTLLLGAGGPVALFTEPALAVSPADVDRIAEPAHAPKDLLMFKDPAQRERLLLFAAHRSHSSHSSHSSHYSGSGGGYAAPVPLYTPPPAPPSPRPTPTPRASSSGSTTAGPAVAPLMSSTRLAGTEIEDMVRKVQLALIIRQYDPGPVDGALSAKTKAALSKFQADRGLTVSGFMDLQTLQALDVLR